MEILEILREVSEISIIQDKNDIHINPKPRCKYVKILEISGKFQKFQLYQILMI